MALMSMPGASLGGLRSFGTEFPGHEPRRHAKTMSEERTINRTFFQAPQSVTPLVAALLEPGITLLTFLATLLALNVPVDRPALALCLLAFALTFASPKRLRSEPLATGTRDAPRRHPKPRQYGLWRECRARLLDHLAPVGEFGARLEPDPGQACGLRRRSADEQNEPGDKQSGQSAPVVRLGIVAFAAHGALTQRNRHRRAAISGTSLHVSSRYSTSLASCNVQFSTR